MVAPFIGERVGRLPIRHVEDAAITVLAAVYQQSGPLREQLLTERPRFERLVHTVHRCPDRGGGTWCSRSSKPVPRSTGRLCQP
jgi:hypothetical protein